MKLLVALMMVFLAVSVQAADIKLAFVGDIMVARKVGRSIQTHGLHYPFAKVTKILHSADIAFGNFECTLSGRHPTYDYWLD